MIGCGGPEDDPQTGGGNQTDPAAQSQGQNPASTGAASIPEIQPGQLRNVLLVTFDTTRADHIACYGSENSSTPTLDYLARTGVRFTQCISTAPITLPSHASLMTGQYPYNHGVRNNGTHKLPDEAMTLAERLKDHGYETGAVISAMVLNERFGIGQGFDSYDQNLAAGSFKNVYLARETPAADTIKRAKQWLAGRTDKPFFLWVHLFDPHHPYTPPAEYADRVNGNPYDGELAYADEQLGVLLTEMQNMDLLRHTLVVATADHGESLGEHGESTHSIFLYDSCIRVPLIFSHSQVAQNEVRNAAVSLVDIAPTVLDMLQLPALETADGQSLALQLANDQGTEPAMMLEQALRRRVVYSESMLPYYNFGWAALRSLRSADGRYIQAPYEELYSLANDPGELVNLVEQSPADADVFRRIMAETLPENEANHQFSNFDDLPAAEKAALIALGYVGNVGAPGEHGTGENGVAEEDRPDPKDAILYFGDQTEALELARTHSPGAEEALRAVLADNPDELRCQSALAEILIATDRAEEALPIVQRLAKLQGAGAMEILALAQLERQLGMPEWEEHYAAARAVDPNDPAPLIFLGDYAGQQNEWEEAIGHYDDALALDPGNLIALIQKGLTQRYQNDLAASQATFYEALQINPDIYMLQLQLGFIAENQGAHEEAVAYFRRATELGPNRRQAWRHFGSNLLRLKRFRNAMDAFEKAAALDDPNIETYRNLGLLSVSFGKAAQAIPALERTLAANADDWQAHLMLAVALDQQSNEAGAQEHLDAARRLSADLVSKQAESRKDVAALLKKYP